MLQRLQQLLQMLHLSMNFIFDASDAAKNWLLVAPRNTKLFHVLVSNMTHLLGGRGGGG